MKDPVIIVHGGAGQWPRERQKEGLDGVRTAAAEGWKVLKRGGSSVDAVEVAVVSMEDNSVFNAGLGSSLNLIGNVEMDAAIMDGRGLEGGAVANVRRVKNPVKLARIVMEKTDHVLMAGPEAERFAVAQHVPLANLQTQEKVRAWRRGLILFRRGRLGHLSRNRRLLLNRHLPGHDTVGALALDAKGNVAAACSTGGLMLKLPGRIGDTAILGAGLYADNSVGAATATGVGELAIRTVISKAACELMVKTFPATAARQCIRMTGARLGRGLGILTLDRKGRHGVAHNTRHLCWAVARGAGNARAFTSGTRV